MDPRQCPVVLPALKVAVQGTSGRQVLWDVPPLATGTEHVHDAVDDFPNIDLAITSPMFGGRDLSVNVRPLLVGQVTRVAKLVPIVSGAVLWSPHAAPRESVPRIESQSFRAGQPPSLTDPNDSRSSRTDTYFGQGRI